MVFSLSFFIFLFLPRPPRDLRLPCPPLVPANRFRLKPVAPALNWYPGWGSNPQDFRR